jgi:hypothetical protein
MIDLHPSIAVDFLDLHISRTRSPRIGACLAIATSQKNDRNHHDRKDERKESSIQHEIFSALIPRRGSIKQQGAMSSVTKIAGPKALRAFSSPVVRPERMGVAESGLEIRGHGGSRDYVCGAKRMATRPEQPVGIS